MALTDPALLWIWLLPLMLWEAVWKGVGLWKAGRNNQPWWFVPIFIFNTLGILPIVYIFFFQRKSR